MKMADQDWKRDGWTAKYIIRKKCGQCDGTGRVPGGPNYTYPCLSCDGSGERKVAPDALYFVLRLDCGPDGPHERAACKGLPSMDEAVWLCMPETFQAAGIAVVPPHDPLADPATMQAA
jgi:hypothetical protein